MGKAEDGVIALLRVALWMTLGVIALVVALFVTMTISARRAYSRAEVFCAATPPGMTAEALTIRALDHSTQVRTDIEPGALVVRFPAWGFAPAVGECRATVVEGRVTATRVVREGYN
jgi:hypothetical protein